MFTTFRRAGRALLPLLLAVSVGVSPSALAASPALVAASPTPPPNVVTFGLGPATAHGVLDRRPYYNFAASGGGSLIDHFLVLNYSVRPLTLQIYATDGYNNATGANELLDATKTPHDVGAWMHVLLPHNQLVVPARSATKPGSVLVGFRLQVPLGAPAGDHVGGIVAALRTYAKNVQGFTFPLDQRVATPVYLRISGALHPRLVVNALRAHYRGTANPAGRGSVVVTYTVRNEGNVALAAHQSVTVSGLIGSWPARHLADVPLLLPGGSASVRAVVPDVFPQVRMHASVRLTALPRTTDVLPSTPAVTARVGFWAVPWVLIAIVLAMVLGYAAWRRRRRRTNPPGRHAARGSRRAQDVPEQPRVRETVASRVAAVLGLALVFVAAVAVGPAAADSPPFQDLQSAGGLALCDRSGHAVTSGSVSAHPFVWSVVSGVAAPSPYNGNGASATLYAAQPRKDAYPDRWNTDTLTASSQYPAGHHPAAAGTLLDESLAEFVKAYPARWDGYVELRLYWGAQAGYDQNQYASAVVQITGDSWRLVSGGTGGCGTSKPVSTEVTVAGLDTSHRPAASGRTPATASKGADAKTARAGGAGGALSGPVSATNTAARSSGSSGWLLRLVIVAAVAVAALSTIPLWRRRRRPHATPAG